MKEPTISPEELATLIVRSALDKKAQNIVVLNVKEVASFADYFIVCSGQSNRQVQAIASGIGTLMKKEGVLPLGKEGETDGTWILLDYQDVILHVFHDPIRYHYNLEGFWADAPRVAFGDGETEEHVDIALP